MGMSRHLRFIPDGGALVEVTCRTVQGRLLLVPSPQLNDIILGVLGRAQRLHPVEVVAYAFASNHFHALLQVDNAKQLSDFMCYLSGNLAKEIGRRTGWKEKVWGRRYQAIVISEEEEMQVARLRYILSHGVKEGLVARVEEWPGVHCAVPLMTGAEVLGTWFDRTREYNARLRGKELEKGESASTEVVVLSPLPCWSHLAPEVYRERIREMVREIDEAAAAVRAESLIPPLGADGVRSQNPETRPRRIKKSPAPPFHALRKAVRKALWEAYGHFVAAFREAAERWREGDRGAAFPVGSFPPGLPFVEA
jgi:REP element-mobilizing transposase RayT